MMNHPIPKTALDDRLGFIGTSGSGKTYNAGGAVERLLGLKSRVVIIDPLGVWWGLRLLADGKTQSDYDVAIFGGPHGDLPLTEHAGALIGETAATMAESCIVDLSELGTKSAERAFMTAFLETIYRKANKEPFHLIVDEADLFAPQNPPKGDETLLNRMEQIVRRGRVKGFIPWLISQRPAVLNKNVLSQVDGLVAFKLTATQDRDALDGWIEGQADKSRGKEIKAALPAMQIGEGIVWLPGRGVLETAKFPAKLTYDSSRTPKRGEKVKRTASLKPLDLGALKDRLATVEAETKANDPKALKAEVAKLRRELATKPVTQIPTADPQAVESAYQNGLAEGLARGESRAKAALAAVESRLKDALAVAGASIESLDSPMPAPLPRTSLQKMQIAPRAARPTAPLVKANGQFNRSQHKVLRSMAMWRSLGHDSPSREMVAAASGYSPSSGGFNNLLGGLATAGAIGKPMPGHLNLLMAVDDMSADEGREMLLGYLTNPQRKLVDALNGAGGITRDDLGAATEYSPSSGGFNNLIGSLSTLGLIVKPQAGYVALADWAQELLA